MATEDQQLTPDEIADRTIDFIESIGPALQPWQATTLRAMLTYPVGTRFVTAPPQHNRYVTAPPMDVIRKQIQDDLERFVSRTGFVSDQVLADEPINDINWTEESAGPQPNPNAVKVWRKDKGWTWITGV